MQITKIGNIFCASYPISKALHKLYLHSWHSAVTVTARQHPTESQSTRHTNRPIMSLPFHLGKNALLILPSTSNAQKPCFSSRSSSLLTKVRLCWPAPCTICLSCLTFGPGLSCNFTSEGVLTCMHSVCCNLYQEILSLQWMESYEFFKM